MSQAEPLTFTTLDGLAFAAERGRLSADPGGLILAVQELGPFMEYLLLAKSGLLPEPERASWLALNGVGPLYSAFSNRRHSWVCPYTRHIGVYRTHKNRPHDDQGWITFSVAAQWAAISMGCPRSIAVQIIGAIGEMENNIYEHSQAAATGFISFKATPGTFEFSVADRGIGVLQSLKMCPEYSGLADYGEALRMALKDGVSRFGTADQRGTGFRPLFTGLANLNGSLRFRSGDHALTMVGNIDPHMIAAKLAKKALMAGFFASVRCGW